MLVTCFGDAGELVFVLPGQFKFLLLFELLCLDNVMVVMMMMMLELLLISPVLAILVSLQLLIIADGRCLVVYTVVRAIVGPLADVHGLTRLLILVASFHMLHIVVNLD